MTNPDEEITLTQTPATTEQIAKEWWEEITLARSERPTVNMRRPAAYVPTATTNTTGEHS